MTQKERLQELMETMQQLRDDGENFIIEIPLKEEDADAEEEHV